MEIQLWREILNPYELAVKEVMTKFNHLIKEHQDRGLYCPIGPGQDHFQYSG